VTDASRKGHILHLLGLCITQVRDPAGRIRLTGRLDRAGEKPGRVDHMVREGTWRERALQQPPALGRPA
jgi:hypothetical protein